jgi:tetratricopeptide (TPR) repeat protein
MSTISQSLSHARKLLSHGDACQDQDRLDGAVVHYQQALRFEPNLVEAHNSLGVAFTKQSKFDAALACYDRVIQLEAGNARAHVNRGLLWLMMGNWAAGWPEFEWRLRTPRFLAKARPQPRWDGSALAGRTLLVQTEQGLGDTLQFIRFLPLLKPQDGRVVVQCPAPLPRLLAGLAGTEQLVAAGSPLPAFDVHAQLLSLPAIFQTTLATLPCAVPYLQADPKLVGSGGKN